MFIKKFKKYHTEKDNWFVLINHTVQTMANDYSLYNCITMILCMQIPRNQTNEFNQSEFNKVVTFCAFNQLIVLIQL